MAIEYKFAGKKGSRKVVKTIDITDESYNGIKGMLESGMNMTDAINGPLISDTYNIFGGNCYGMLVSMAIQQMIASIIHELEDKKNLKVDGEEAFHKLSGIILPLMCYSSYTSDGDEYAEELNFFNTNSDEIVGIVNECIIDKKAAWFAKQLTETSTKDNRPAGEIACALLMYMANDA